MVDARVPPAAAVGTRFDQFAAGLDGSTRLDAGPGAAPPAAAVDAVMDRQAPGGARMGSMTGRRA
jgi:hypothetical protein